MGLRPRSRRCCRCCTEQVVPGGPAVVADVDEPRFGPPPAGSWNRIPASGCSALIPAREMLGEMKNVFIGLAGCDVDVVLVGVAVGHQDVVVAADEVGGRLADSPGNFASFRNFERSWSPCSWIQESMSRTCQP